MSRVSTPAQTGHTSDATSRPVATSTADRLRSPFVGFNEMFNNWIPVHEKGLRNGFYNSIALFILLVVLIVIYYSYCVLKPFVSPLVWAVLCGSALHPFKRRLLLCSANWISDTKTSGHPISVATLLLPLVTIKFFAQVIENFWSKYYKLILAFVVPMLVNQYFGHHLFSYSQNIFNLVYSPVVNFTQTFVALLSHLTKSENTLIIVSTAIGYLIAVSFGWTDSTKKFLAFMAPFVWISLLINITFLCGTFGQILALALLVIVMIGLIHALVGGPTQSGTSDNTDGVSGISMKMRDGLKTIANYLASILGSLHNSEEEFFEPTHDTDNESTGDVSETEPSVTDSQSVSRRTSLMSTNENEENASNRYLYAVLWAVVIVQIYSHKNFIYLALIPITLKRFLTIVLTKALNMFFNNIQLFNEFIDERNRALFHPILRNIFNYFLIGDRIISSTIESSLNGLISLSVISITIISIIFLGIFMSIQIYGESIHLINSVGNALNNTINSYPNSGQLLPQSFKGIDGILDQMVQNGYEYGRDYIKDFVNNALNVAESDNKTRAVEKQILEIWDRAYHLWLIRNTNESDLMPKKGPYDIDKLYSALASLNVQLCFNIVKENIDTLLSVVDSVWLVLKGNVSLLLTALVAVFSLLLGGGLGLMNLMLGFVIFTTALFYLLSASGEYYKPVELVTRFLPSETTSHSKQTNLKTNTTNKFGCAVEEAVNGVFAASLKMSAFYGLYTYLIHILFDVNIVYIPSVMAAILGAVPFLSPFWASFPASLELFFAHQQRAKGILLLISAYLPSLFVDSTIYSEIKSGGHPYLTGLAIAGGVFYLGFEGAIFGPMLLCFLFVAFNMYTSIMEESPVKTEPKMSQFRRMQSMLF